MPKLERARSLHKQVTLAELIDAGYLAPSVRLRATYGTPQFAAIITGDDRLKYRGRLYQARRYNASPLSTLAGLTLMKVRDPPPGRKVVPRDGWPFWKILSPSDGWVPIRSVRDQYLSADEDPA